MDLQEMLTLSERLNNGFTKDKVLDKKEMLNSSLLALTTEAGELANELNQWKYWKNNKTIDHNRVEDEFADVMLFTFSIALQLGYDGSKLEEIYMRKYLKNINRIKEGY